MSTDHRRAYELLGRGDIEGALALAAELVARPDATAGALAARATVLKAAGRPREALAANQAAVYRRMQTSRQQQAAETRAEGEQRKREIIAGADREVAITLATAHQEAETTRGEGDAQRTRLFAQSFGRDPAFASFYRSMQAYEASLGRGDTTMVLSPDSEFFKYFDGGPNAR